MEVHLNPLAVKADIANAGQTSGAIDISGFTLVGIQMPAAFTGIQMTFTVATSAGGTYQTLTDIAGGTYTINVSASKYIYLDPAVFAGVRYFKIVSGTAEGAARTVELVTRRMA